MVTIPGPQENDADDVSLALEVAQSQWTRGDRAEALKWLKKAVDAAFEADDDKRGMELSKVAAEVKAELDKPRIPPPKGAPPLRPSAPPPRKSVPAQPPPPQRKAAPKETPSELEATGTRRSSAPSRRGSKSSIQTKPVEEDEATREYQLGDMGAEDEAAIADEWPTETLDNIDDLVDAPDQTAARALNKSRSKSGSRTVKTKSKADAEPEPEPKQAAKHKRQDLGMSVPSTRSIRVAVGRDKGAVYVRLLDSQGLRTGEHDAMLVALTSDGDIRGLFR